MCVLCRPPAVPRAGASGAATRADPRGERGRRRRRSASDSDLRSAFSGMGDAFFSFRFRFERLSRVNIKILTQW